jgi:hypothetical protein
MPQKGHTEEQIWAVLRQVEAGARVELRQEIASAIAKQIRMTLTPGEQIRAETEHPVNVEAYESHWRGEYFLNRVTPERDFVGFRTPVDTDKAGSVPEGIAGLAPEKIGRICAAMASVRSLRPGNFDSGEQATPSAVAIAMSIGPPYGNHASRPQSRKNVPTEPSGLCPSLACGAPQRSRVHREPQPRWLRDRRSRWTVQPKKSVVRALLDQMTTGA